MYNNFDNYKKNDPRMWFFHTKLGGIILKIIIVFIVATIILKLFGIEL
jgi:hypothetical protein